MPNWAKWLMVAAGGVLTSVAGELFSQQIFKKAAEKQVKEKLEEIEEKEVIEQ